MSRTRQQPTVTPPAAHLRPTEAAALLGVSTDTLRIWCEVKKHPGLEGATVTLPSGHRRYVETVIRAYAKRIGRAA